MKILIVDDDLNIVDVIVETIDWKALGIEEVFRAYSGTMAQEVVLKENPEVILCDIEMPILSGLDFLRWLRANKFETEFIFLTCHDDFNFAAEAIEYGVTGYIMKPFNLNKTVPVIVKAIERVRRNKRIIQQETRFSDYRRNNIKYFWLDFFQEQNPKKRQIMFSQIKEARLGINDSENYSLILISAPFAEDEIEPDISFILQNIASELFLGDPQDPNSFFYETESGHVVLCVSTELKRKVLSAAAEKMVLTAKEYLGRQVNCFLACGYPIDQLAEQRSRLNKWSSDMPVIRGQVFAEWEISENRQEEISTLSVQDYTMWLEEGRQITIIRHLSEEINRLESYNARKGLDAIYHDFVQIIYSVLAKHEIQAHLLLQDENYQKMLRSVSQSAFNLIKWANYTSERVTSIIREVQESGSIIKRSLKYISEHYQEDIGRNEIAGAVFLTPDYFAKCFKKEMGESVNDYLIRYRLGKAKERICHTNETVGETAINVGFGSATYFSTVFKKYMGMTPNEYKRKVASGSQSS